MGVCHSRSGIESKNISVALTDSMLTGYMYAYAGVYDYELDTAMEVIMAENLKIKL